MAYKIDDWPLGNINPEDIERGTSNTQTFTTPGLRTVKIVDAKYFDEFTAEDPKKIDTYTVTIESVEEGPEFGTRALLTYWLKNQERTKYSENTLGTLRSIGTALFNDQFTQMIPAPTTILGGVVMADIKLGKPDALGRVFPKVYHFSAASSDFSIFSEIEQYYRGAGQS